MNLPEMNTGEESRIIEGYAVVFNCLSLNLGGFYEKISREACEFIIERFDILAILNHDVKRGVLARSNKGQGSLSLKVDNIGVRYSFEAPYTFAGLEAYEAVRRGDVTGASFTFRTTPIGEQWKRTAEGDYIRTITEFTNVLELSLVYNPAYPDTSARLKSFITR